MEHYVRKLKIGGRSEGHLDNTERHLRYYLEGTGGDLSFNALADYLEDLQERYAAKTYRDHFVTIKAFLKSLDVEFAEDLTPPSTPPAKKIHVTAEDVRDLLRTVEESDLSKDVKQRFRAAHVLAATSGMRATEVYRLTPDRIDLENGLVRIDRDKNNGSRWVVFNGEATRELRRWLDMWEGDRDHDRRGDELFNKRSILYVREELPDLDLSLKHMRKFFSQAWERNKGPGAVKKMLMGHSLDIDGRHYSGGLADDPEELREIYDEVGVRVGLTGKH